MSRIILHVFAIVLIVASVLCISSNEPLGTTTTMQALPTNVSAEYCIALNYSDRISCFNTLGLEYVDVCERENTSARRIDCYNYFSMVNHNPRVCEVLPQKDREECYCGCAVNLLNPELCNNAPTIYPKLICLGYSAAESQNRSVCEHIPSEGFFREILVYDRNYSVYRDLCYTGVAVTKNLSINDTAGCAFVVDAEMRHYCIALVLNDTSFCETINDTFRREKCFDDVPTVTVGRSLRGELFPDRVERVYYVVWEPKLYPPIEDENETNPRSARIW